MPRREPDLRLGALVLRIRGPVPCGDEGEPGDWLLASASCHSAGSRVEVTDQPILQLSGLNGFRRQLQGLIDGHPGEALLASSEPDLSLSLKPYLLGQFELAVRISPDAGMEQHTYTILLDRDDLLAAAAGLDTALAKLGATAGQGRE